VVQLNGAGQDLRYANLSEADLTGAKMKNAKINGYTIFCNTKTPWGLDNSGCKEEVEEPRDPFSLLPR
jgi:uncharacterized protein YjbI with pentapeptide repeats